ncbi:MAG: hypothetical protein AAF985_08780, partial [Bacteroidota bacterium]
EKNKIKIRYQSETKSAENWEIIHFEMTDFTGAYHSKHFKLVNQGKATFWDFPEALYKSKSPANDEHPNNGWWLTLWKMISRYLS